MEIRQLDPTSWEAAYWRLRIRLIRASLWQLFIFWVTRNESRLYGDKG